MKQSNDRPTHIYAPPGTPPLRAKHINGGKVIIITDASDYEVQQILSLLHRDPSLPQ